MPELSPAADLIITGVFSILWWLLRQKDAAQQRQIDEVNKAIMLLFEKHDGDAERLDNFKLEIAKMHYIKPELDGRFRAIEATMKEGFDRIIELIKEQRK